MRILLVALLTVALAACARDSSRTASPPDDPTPPPAMSDAAPIVSLSPQETEAFLASHPDAVVVDVRTPAEIAESGKLEGAVELDVNAPDFEGRALGRLSPTAPTVLYCRSGGRSGRAAEILRDQGFAELYNAGGFGDLAGAGLATEGGQ